jgi:hypothetical protein
MGVPLKPSPWQGAQLGLVGPQGTASPAALRARCTRNGNPASVRISVFRLPHSPVGKACWCLRSVVPDSRQAARHETAPLCRLFRGGNHRRAS